MSRAEKQPLPLGDRICLWGSVAAAYAAIGVMGYLSFSLGGGWSERFGRGQIMNYSGRPPVERWLLAKQETLRIQRPSLGSPLDLAEATRLHKSLYVRAADVESYEDIMAHIQRVCEVGGTIEPLHEENLFGALRLRTVLAVYDGSCIAIQPSSIDSKSNLGNTSLH